MLKRIKQKTLKTKKKKKNRFDALKHILTNL